MLLSDERRLSHGTDHGRLTGSTNLQTNQAWRWQSTAFSINWSDYMTWIKYSTNKKHINRLGKVPDTRQKNGCRKQNHPYLNWHKSPSTIVNKFRILPSLNYCEGCSFNRALHRRPKNFLNETFHSSWNQQTTTTKRCREPQQFCFPQLTWSDPNSHARSLEGKKIWSR